MELIVDRCRFAKKLIADRCIMKRKLYDRLLLWKNERKGESAVLVNGARRVGKSYIVKQFAQNEYRSCIFLDFNKVSNGVKSLFDDYLDDLDTFFMYLSSYANTTLYPRESVIVLDEVQLYPRARAAIKYLVEDGRYDYIETGSLVSIKKNVANIMIPSEEEEIQMYPMDFEEFLWAMGNETLMPLVRTNFEKRHEMGQMMHRKAMDYFRQYLIVGGMPQAVAKYAEERNFNKVDQVKRQILALYRNDIQKYADSYASKVTRIFDTLPAQLQRHEKKFMLKALEEGARMRNYETAFFWLADAMIVNMAYNATEPSVGLGMNVDDTTLKCYMADTGLLISHAFNENTIVAENLYNKLLTGKLEFNGGMVVENVVAQMLRSAGHKLYFFSKYSKANAEERMELDFLIAKNVLTTKHNISPVEVKSTNRYTLTSLKKCVAKYGNYLSTPYVLHTSDVKEEDGIVFLPLYMAGLL